MKKVNIGRTRTTTSISCGYFTDSETGESGVGMYKKTQEHYIFETLYHDVELAESLNFLTINYYVAFVAAEEEIKIGDKTMNAFVIESETWIKSTLIQDFKAEKKMIEEQQLLRYKKIREKMDSKAIKKGYTNKEGYIVVYKKEWFVPGYGIVAAETYDKDGGFQTKTQTIYE